MGKSKNTCFLLLLLLPFQLLSQKGFDIPINQKIVVRFDDRIVHVDLIQSNKRVKVRDDRYYYWYNSNDIKVTRGGFDGKLLHGHYIEFFLNKNLREKGNFKKGLKVGEWKSWNLNGEFREIAHWKKGRQEGKTWLYNEKGGLIKESFYKNGQLSRKTKMYLNDGTIESIRYKKGQPVMKAPKRSILKRVYRKEKKEKSPDSPSNPPPKKHSKKVAQYAL